LTEDEVRRALATVIDPELGRDIVDLGMVRDIIADDVRVGATIVLTTAGCPLRNRLRAEAEAALDAPQAVHIVSRVASEILQSRRVPWRRGAQPDVDARGTARRFT
jgi:ATP-binding protein involved in chromosome partitioning